MAKLGQKLISNFVKNHIKEYRKTRGLSQAALAKKTGYTTMYIGNIENFRGQPSVEAVYRISAALQTKPEDLFYLSFETYIH